MNLRLYRVPHTGADRPDVARLLFEAASGQPQKFGCRDFYLYVWIGNGSLDGFQAVMDDEYVLSCNGDSKPAFGSIGKQPFNRAIVESRLISRRKKLLRIVRDLRSDEFPDLLTQVGIMAQGHGVCRRKLVEGERKVLSILTKEHR